MTSKGTNHIRAMILAAGRGERMRPLTDSTPKPLLHVHGKPLIRWHLEALARGGFDQVVVNTAWLGEQLVEQLDTKIGSNLTKNEHSLLYISEQQQTTASVTFSHEGIDFGGALETAGGIARALPQLCNAGEDAFWVLAGDIYAPNFEFSQAAVERFKASDKLAHIWLVPNPEHNPKGDFGLTPEGRALSSAEIRFTFSTIGLYRSPLFAPPYCSIAPGNPLGTKAPLAPLLRAAMDAGLVSAQLYEGPWTDVGTPERLQWLNRSFFRQQQSP